MNYDRFFIGPLNKGYQTDIRPFLLPEDAWVQMRNAYAFRGRIRKRFGSRYMGTGVPTTFEQQFLSRLRLTVDTTDSSGDLAPTVVGPVGTVWTEGQAFSVGDTIFTVYQANGDMAVQNPDGTTTATGTFDTATGTVSITGAEALTPVYFYPALPVMGLTNYQTGPINDQPSYAFDTRFAYKWTGNGWDRSGTGTSPLFKGDDLDFFWATNYQGLTDDIPALYITNFNASVPTPQASDDVMWYTDDGTTWNDFSAKTIFVTAGNYVQTARLIVSYKGHLLLLNTIETDQTNTTNKAYPNRCRFSSNGSALSATSWLETNNTITIGPDTFQATGAGFIDASTDEAIVSCRFIKDRLIVQFERSTWELAYTGNNIFPFIWNRLNSELGCEATFSTVPFDQAILAIGNVGITSCNGSNVQRIDTLIPDTVFEIKDKAEGVARVAGIRDYYTEMVYWTLPSDNETGTQSYPNRVLVYNYRNGSWAINDDCITAWGYFEQQTDLTWQNALFTWEETNNTWQSGVIEADFRQIIAGNQQGYVFIIDTTQSRNASVMQITTMSIASPFVTIVSYNHNLVVGDYVAIENLVGINQDIKTIYQVTRVDDVNTFVLYAPDVSGTYVSGGTIAKVSNIDILSKPWNFYLKQGRSQYLGQIDFFVQRTTNGQITVDYYSSFGSQSLVDDGINSKSLLGTSILETSPYPRNPHENQQDTLIHRVYLQANGSNVQIRLSFSPEQITTSSIAWSDFELEAMMLYAKQTSNNFR